jgi:hypothetical protein
MIRRVGKAVNAPGTNELRMREIYEFTARTLKTRRPTPFGALIVESTTGRTSTACKSKFPRKKLHGARTWNAT